jgi:release factor glutamine methyltransferase
VKQSISKADASRASPRALADNVETALALTRKAAAHLEAHGIENSRLDSELLLAGALGTTRLQLYLDHDRPVAGADLERYRSFIRRRLKREPVQYILGDAPFRGLTLHVDRRVLIPRPETEVLVGEILRWTAAGSVHAAAGRNAVADSDAATHEHRRELTALDVGTGSGAIALSLLAEGPFSSVIATDVSDEALEVARSNAQRAGLDSRLELRCGSVWECIAADEQFDVVVANPPYIADAERSSLAPEVRDWEPPAALFAGTDGTDVLHEIVDSAGAHIRAGGLLALEVGVTQAQAIRQRALEKGFQSARVIQDYTGRERVVLAIAPGSASDA